MTDLTKDRVDTGSDSVSAGLFEASVDCVKLIDLEGKLLAMNVNGLCLMEIDDFTPLKGQAWDSLWPEATRPIVADAVKQAISGAVTRFSAECPTAKGQLRVWDVIVSPVYDATGRAVQVVSISQDITEQRRVLEQNALMSLELAHRIKNVFAVVDGVVALSARAEPESAPFADILRRRLHALGRATSYVTPSDVGDGKLQTFPTLFGLLHTLLEPYGAIEGLERRLVITGDDVPVGASATTAVALVINELATNAVKYGALKSTTGQVELAVTRQDDVIEFVWAERGAVDVSKAVVGEDGFGSTLLHNAVVRLLKGTLQRTWADGLRVCIQIPATSLAR